jgi:predicted P-loop ATPase
MLQVYNPFAVYFDTLPIWDINDTDYIDELAQKVHCTNNDIFRSIFKKWMVKSIKCLFEDHYVNDMCLVLLGKQHTFKTTFINNLLPEKMRDEYYTSKYINMEKDDDWKLLYQYWLINFDEMAAVKSRNNSENLVKMYMSNPKIDNRRLFKETFDFKYRVASFMGSSNDTDFLKDLTGERRFAICEVISIDIDEADKINKDEVWAQAWSLYVMDYDHEFTNDEKEYLFKATTEVRQMDFDEELIVTQYSFQNKDDDGIFVSSSDVVNYLTEQYPRHASKFNAIRIGKILSKYSKHKKLFTGNITKHWVKYNIQTNENDVSHEYRQNKDVPQIDPDKDELPF